jgi:hypothetical protein
MRFRRGQVARRLKQRGGIWYYWRQVPARYADIDSRGWVAISLETRDLARAERLKGSVERELEAYWVSLKRGNSDDGKERYRGAIERARLEGFDYRPATDLAQSSLEDILARLERLEELGALRADGTSPSNAVAADRLAVEALLGGVEAPTLRRSSSEWRSLSRSCASRTTRRPRHALSSSAGSVRSSTTMTAWPQSTSRKSVGMLARMPPISTAVSWQH